MKSSIVVTVGIAVLLRLALASAWASPVPVMTFLDFAAPGQTVLFSALGSFVTDPARSLVLFNWNFGDGSPTQTSPAPFPVVHAFSVAAAYAVELRVTNDLSEQTSLFRVASIGGEPGVPSVPTAVPEPTS